jgi:hypothetical protein
MCGQWLQRLAAIIDDSCDEWGDFDLLKVKGLSICNAKGNKLRMDPHAKTIVLAEAVEAGRSSTSAGMVRAMDLGDSRSALAWAEERLSDLQASCRLTFNNPEVMAFAMDGSRLGKPAKEYLQIVQYSWPADKSMVMAPQASPTECLCSECSSF